MQRRLGKGLSEIIDSTPRESGGAGATMVSIRVDQIRPGRYQPRASIKPEQLQELAASIKRQGVIQPVLVRPIAHGTYELVAGERRWRAAQLAGIQEIPAVVRSLGDRETLEHALIENMQRVDLNPIEEAKAYERMSSEFGYTQETIAETVGKDRATIANAMRLLKLPETIQQALKGDTLTMGHAKALLAVDSPAKQLEFFNLAISKQLSVRQLEALASGLLPATRARRSSGSPELDALQHQLRQALGTKVRLIGRKKGGRIIIEYFSPEDLTRVLAALGLGPTT